MIPRGKGDAAKESGIVKRISSNDIARLAGVSRSTVSRVINGYSNVPPETYERVMKVVKEHHYYPQISGRALSGKSTNTIGLFWVGRHRQLALNPLTSAYFMHIIDAAAERGYLVLASFVDNLTEKANLQSVRKIYMEGRIDAGIFIGVSNTEPLLDELMEMDKIVGAFDYYHEGEDQPHRLSSNFERDSGEAVIDYLYSLGHRKIAIIDGDLSRLSCIHRHESFMRGMMKHSLPIKNQWLAYGGIVKDTGYPAAKAMLLGCLDDLPTAICANNDDVAFGVYQACAELGLRIPEDISVVGMDCQPAGETSSPPLTSVYYDFQQLFASLTNRVIDTIEEKPDVLQADFIPGRLLVRESTAPPRREE